MRLFLEQLKKFKVTNDLSKYIYLLNNTVLYTDGQIYIKKHVGYNFGGNYEVNTKNLLDLVKGLKSITDVKIENDLLIINNQYKIKVSETGMRMPVVLSDDNLLNKKIMSGVNIKDIKEFAKVGAGQGIYSILKNICIKENEIAVTDGNRLNILNIETFKGNESYLLPAELITKNISKSVDIFVNDNYISVVGDYGIMTQQKDCGQYPKYNQLIPQKEPEQITTPEPEPEQKEEFEKQVEKLPDDVKEVLDDVKEKMMASPEYKKIISSSKPINAEVETYEPQDATIKPDKKIVTSSEHVNIVTGQPYFGKNNLQVLNNAGFTSREWCGSAQAKKLKKQVKAGAKGVTIHVYFEDESGRAFCKVEKIYNVEQLEPLQQVEKTSGFKNMIDNLKNKFSKAV